MLEAGPYLFAVGITIAGIGISMALQGMALEKRPGRINIGAWAYGLGMGYIAIGIMVVVWGIVAMAH